MPNFKTQSIVAGVTLIASINGLAADVPLYKPSSRSPEPIDISSNQYGASSLAPTALNISDRAPDFTLPVSGGGAFNLTDAVAKAPVVMVFYRGHW